MKLAKTQEEKYYQAVAQDFTVYQRLFMMCHQEEAIEAMQEMVASTLEGTLSEIRQSIAEKLSQPEDEWRVEFSSRVTALP